MATLGTFTAGQVLTAAELNAIGTWTAFTPVWTNLTVGNGVVTAAYCQINDVVLVQVELNFGSTTSVSSLIFMNHPVGTAEEIFFSGTARMLDFGGGFVVGVVQTNTSNCRILSMTANTTFVGVSNTSATNPFTWATDDSLRFQYWYRKV